MEKCVYVCVCVSVCVLWGTHLVLCVGCREVMSVVREAETKLNPKT